MYQCPHIQVFAREICNSGNKPRADGFVFEGNYAEIIQSTVPFPVGYYLNLVLSEETTLSWSILFFTNSWHQFQMVFNFYGASYSVKKQGICISLNRNVANEVKWQRKAFLC